MAYDEGLAALLRDDLTDAGTVEEKRMFGGLCFMVNGHMVCGVHKGGGLFRVGKAQHDTALALPGVGPMTMTGRSMGGLVDVTPEAMGDDGLRARLLSMALDFTATLPER